MKKIANKRYCSTKRHCWVSSFHIVNVFLSRLLFLWNVSQFYLWNYFSTVFAHSMCSLCTNSKVLLNQILFLSNWTTPFSVEWLESNFCFKIGCFYTFNALVNKYFCKIYRSFTWPAKNFTPIHKKQPQTIPHKDRVSNTWLSVKVYSEETVKFMWNKVDLD